MIDSNLKSELEEFKNATPIAPPAHITNAIKNAVDKDLNAMPWKMFSKLSIIHFFSAAFTLSFCPQFGFRVLGEGMGLMVKFMGLGPHGCMVACGFFFMGTSLLFTSLVLKPFEILAIRRHRITQIGSVTLLSLGFFIMIGAEQVLASFALAWIFGSIAGGMTILEIGWALRRPIRANI